MCDMNSINEESRVDFGESPVLWRCSWRFALTNAKGSFESGKFTLKITFESRDAEPEPPEPTHFGRSRSRRNGLLGAGAVKNGAAPAPKMDTIVEKMLTAKQQTAERTDCLYFFINNFRTSSVNCLKFSSLPEANIFYDLNIKEVVYQVKSCH